ncbi:hypothetical protein CT3_26290 [Comamonas terrigena NBRC 13299]|nr:hypothetical protein CT3_26290 [Comamonas terrigena NBRC 13299]
MPVLGKFGDIAQRCAQLPEIALQARIERGLPKAGLAHMVRSAQAEPVLREPLAAKELRSERLQRRSVSGIQYIVYL